MSADDARLQQMISRFVTFHLYATGATLGYVDNDNTSFAGITKPPKKPLLAGSVARTIRFEYHCLQSFDGECSGYDVLLYARKEFEDSYIGVQQIVRMQFAFLPFNVNLHIVVFNMYPCLCQYRIIERTEGVEILRTHFGRTIATH